MSWRLRSPRLLHGLWPLQGNARDLSGHANDGAWARTEAYGAFHKNGLQCANFDGASHVDVAYNTNLNPSVFSACLWACAVGGAGTFRSPLSARGVGYSGFNFYATNADFWEAWFGKGFTWQKITGQAVALGSWVHLAAVYDGSQAFFYNDGRLVAAPLSFTFVPNGANDTLIGVVPGLGFIGLVFDVRIYSVALTNDEVLRLMHRPLPVL